MTILSLYFLIFNSALYLVQNCVCVCVCVCVAVWQCALSSELLEVREQTKKCLQVPPQWMQTFSSLFNTHTPPSRSHTHTHSHQHTHTRSHTYSCVHKDRSICRYCTSVYSWTLGAPEHHIVRNVDMFTNTGTKLDRAWRTCIVLVTCNRERDNHIHQHHKPTAYFYV